MLEVMTVLERAADRWSNIVLGGFRNPPIKTLSRSFIFPHNQGLSQQETTLDTTTKMAEDRKIEFRKSKAKDEPPAELASGSCRSISEFENFCRIGEGTYGTVYRAVDKSSEQVVALKKVWCYFKIYFYLRN
jgi:hypothetical protein